MDSPVSKFVATSTENSWAQSYSAGKLNIVLSLEGNLEGLEIASLGKETLEKLQREFFAIDKKSLESLKKVTGEIAKTIPSEINLSLVLSTIVEDVLYVVTADSGYAVLKRGKNISVIAEGKKGEILGFSGKLTPQDTILLGTEDLFKTISLSDIGKALYLPTPDEISESLAPFLHEKAKGTEAGIAWKIPGLLIPEERIDAVEDTDQILKAQNDTGFSKITEVKLSVLSLLKTVPIPKKLNKKHAVIIIASVLVLFLFGSIFIEQNNKKQNEELKAAQALIDENKPKYEDAIALMSINKSLAVGDLTDVKKNIEENSKNFSPSSPAGKKLNEFLKEINSALGGEGGKSQIGLFYDSSKNKEVGSVSSATAKGEIISAVGDGKGGILTAEGKIDKTFEVSSGDGITADEDNIFILSGNEVFQVSKDSLKSKSIIDSDKDPISIDTFGGNIYLLSKKDKTIYRYRPSKFSQESYLSEVELDNPTSMAIDSSIYILDDGKIRKFTRGREDNFSVKSGTSFGSNSRIFTDIDYANLYVVDPEKKTVFVIDKTGNEVNKFSLKGLKNITSIAAIEKDKKIYITADGNIYSISF